MAVPVNTILDFQTRRGITGLAPAQAASEPVILSQLQAAIEGLAWKDNVRAGSVANVTVSSPGASIDGVTMAASDRVLLKNQTSQPENGIYIWNGSAVPMTRALDANTFDELESAVVTVDEGTNAGTTWRQTQVNGTLGTNNVIWAAFGTSAPAATESTAGIIRIGTQVEVDAGALDNVAVTPLKLATSPFRAKRFGQTIGNGSSTSIAVVHNLNSTDPAVQVFETGGSKREVMVEVQVTDANTVTIVTDTAFATNAARVVVKV